MKEEREGGKRGEGERRGRRRVDDDSWLVDEERKEMAKGSVGSEVEGKKGREEGEGSAF